MQSKHQLPPASLRILTVIFILFFSRMICFSQGETTRISCIGNSITWGATLSDRENNHYPAKLDVLLGPGWEVNNYAYWGRTALRNGDLPYWNIPEFTAAMESNPDIVTIMLGANDAKTLNWFNAGSEFKADFELLIDTFQNLESQPQVWICYTPPALENEFGIDNNIIIDSIIPVLSQISVEMGLPVMDLYSHFLNKVLWYHDDGVHPNLDGSTAIAQKFNEMLKMENPDIEQVGNMLTTSESAGIQWYLNGSPVHDQFGGKEQNLVIRDTGTYKALIYLSDKSDDRILSEEIEVDTINAGVTGDFVVCAGSENVIYNTGSWPGKTLTWEVTDGIITDGQGTSEIMVDWSDQGQGEILLRIIDQGTTDTVIHTAFVYLMENPKPEFELVELNLTASEALSYQWYKNGDTVPATEGGHQMELEAHTGDYHLVVTYDNGCKATSDTLAIIMEGVPVSNVRDPVNFYPNPVNNILYIDYKNSNREMLYVVFYDILGNQVKMSCIPPGGSQTRLMVPVEDLPPGFYFVRLQSGNENIVVKSVLKGY